MIVVTEFPIVTDVSALQSEKAPYPIEIVLFGMAMDDIASQLYNNHGGI